MSAAAATRLTQLHGETQINASLASSRPRPSRRCRCQLETKAQARRAQAEKKLHAGQAPARPAGEQAPEEIDDKIAAAYQR
jgi:hypothetical protein